MRARVDTAKAAASIIMRRKLKGGAAAMQQLASQALLQSSATPNPPVDPAAMGQAPKPGSVIEENDYVQHEAFNLSSGSQGAMQDAQMIRNQYSVGTSCRANQRRAKRRVTDQQRHAERRESRVQVCPIQRPREEHDDRRCCAQTSGSYRRAH
jgi:hypothetical protein